MWRSGRWTWGRQGVVVAVALLAVAANLPYRFGQEANAEVSGTPGTAETTGDEPEVRAVEPGSDEPSFELDLSNLVEREGRLVQETEEGVIETTLDPELQRFAIELLQRYEVPAGAAIAIDSRTGAVLAFAEHSLRSPGHHVGLDASAPAASTSPETSTAW